MLTGFIRHLACENKLLDIPNYRSSHNRPTPHGGGFAFTLCFLALIIIACLYDRITIEACLAIALPGAIIGCVGLVDDIRRVRLSIRLLVHIVCVSLGLLLLPALPEITVLQTSIAFSGLNIAIICFVLVWLINLFNFMDGIDGIAGAEFISVLISAAILLTLLQETSLVGTLVIACTPVLGFLVWNWPPAKIFMGDAGSGFLGYLLGIGGLYVCSETDLTLWSWLILLGVFVVDTSWTLVTRIITRQNWLQPHCSHAYQRLAFRSGSHLLVTMGVLTINVMWLLPMAWLSIRYEHIAELIVFTAYLPLMVFCHLSKAGRTAHK